MTLETGHGEDINFLAFKISANVSEGFYSYSKQTHPAKDICDTIIFLFISVCDIFLFRGHLKEL